MNEEIQETLIAVLRQYFNNLDNEINESMEERYTSSAEYARRRAAAEATLRNFILTDKDKEVMDKARKEAKRDWGDALELIQECDTTTAAKYVKDLCVAEYHREETRAGMN